MPKLKRNFWIIIIVTILMGYTALPLSIKEEIAKNPIGQITTYWPLSLMNKAQAHLGLDLQGGVQLTYKIDLTKAIQQGKTTQEIEQIVEGTKNIIARRVDILGVGEKTIQWAKTGEEYFIIVELADVKNIQKAKDLIGKTVAIEFKEPAVEANTTVIDKFRQIATVAIAKVTPDNIAEIGAEEEVKYPGKAHFNSSQKFQDELSETETTAGLWDTPIGEIHKPVIEEIISVPTEKQIINLTTFSIYKILGKEMVEREYTDPPEDFSAVAKDISELPDEIDLGFVQPDTLPDYLKTALTNLNEGQVSEVLEGNDYYEIYRLEKESLPEEQVEASHILIKVQTGTGEEAIDGHSEEEALTLIEEIYTKASSSGADFTALAKEFSEDPGSKDEGGYLNYFSRATMVPEFSKVAFDDLEVGEVSEPFKSQFGYHIIHKTDQRTTDYKVDLKKIAISKSASGAKALADETLTRLTPQTKTREEEQLSFQVLNYIIPPEPWKETGLGSEQFKGAEITQDPLGRPALLINFNDEGRDLFRDITERNVQKPIAIFVGGNIVSQPTVQVPIIDGSAVIESSSWTYPEVIQLKQLLDAGTFPAPLIVKKEFTVGASLGEESLEKSIYAGLLGLALLAIYMIVYYRLLGLFATFSLTIYAITIIFILKASPGITIVMTLAGIAGFILSVGMAVDANVLIFERIKEELKDGKNLSAAIHIGFERAWTSIRDSNLSTILTCAILAWFGGYTMVRGFAITLGIGVIVSMITAITVTKTFLTLLVRTKAIRIPFLFEIKK